MRDLMYGLHVLEVDAILLLCFLQKFDNCTAYERPVGKFCQRITVVELPLRQASCERKRPHWLFQFCNMPSQMRNRERSTTSFEKSCVHIYL